MKTILICVVLAVGRQETKGEVRASDSLDGFPAAGALDGDRFAAEPGRAWKGKKGADLWIWEISFAEPRAVGSILQVHGESGTILRNAPKRYLWRASEDGLRWSDLKETETLQERRLFRLHRLSQARRVRFLRLAIFETVGEAPTLREVEFFAETSAPVRFPEWAVVVSTGTTSTQLYGDLYINMVRTCPDWKELMFQQVFLDAFDEALVRAEPRPLCAFFTGNSRDWCEVHREPWRGVQEVLRNRHLPIWAACGGAQGLALLEDTGVDKEWDCPRCRDPKNPKSPIYGHIGHTGPAKCGEYHANINEIGPFNVRKVTRDPAFAGLPDEFKIMESHCGQIEYLPKGWVHVITKGEGAKTVHQCIRVKDRYIYAAQFHMESPGTPENSRTIMSNFLSLAREWGGYNPAGRIRAE